MEGLKWWTMTLDPGLTLQIMTVLASLATTYLLSGPKTARWGYLTGFLTLPLWVVMEGYYRQWLYFCLNPIYFWLWGRGLAAHWRQDDQKQKKIP